MSKGKFRYLRNLYAFTWHSSLRYQDRPHAVMMRFVYTDPKAKELALLAGYNYASGRSNSYFLATMITNTIMVEAARREAR